MPSIRPYRGNTFAKGFHKTLSIEQKKAKELMNLMIIKKTAPLVRSALGLALGSRFVYRREPIGKNKFENVLVTDPKEIEEALNCLEDGSVDKNGKYIYITTKEPDMDAIDKLLSRPFGKAKESLEIDSGNNLATSLLSLSLEAMKRNKQVTEGKIIDVDVVKSLPDAS